MMNTYGYVPRDFYISSSRHHHAFVILFIYIKVFMFTVAKVNIFC